MSNTDDVTDDVTNDVNETLAGSTDGAMNSAADDEAPTHDALRDGSVAKDGAHGLPGDGHSGNGQRGVSASASRAPISRRAPSNVQLRRFVSLVITPVVLIAGLLLLGIYQFSGVLRVTTAQDNAFHSVVTYSSGPMQVSFLENAGTNRPSVNYKGLNLVTYSEWSSTIAVNGDVQELWNSYHGYSTDSQKRVIDSTASNAAWQIIQIITVINASTVTVAYDFTYRPQANAPTPQHIELTILHQHSNWSQPVVKGDTFTAQFATASSAANPAGGFKSVGTMTLRLSGPALAPHPLRMLDERNTVQTNGQSQAVATALTSTYILNNPVANVLIPLGVETITFTPAAASK